MNMATLPKSLYYLNATSYLTHYCKLWPLPYLKTDYHEGKTCQSKMHYFQFQHANNPQALFLQLVTERSDPLTSPCSWAMHMLPLMCINTNKPLSESLTDQEQENLTTLYNMTSKFANLQINNYKLQLCKYASFQLDKFVTLQVYKFTSSQIYKIKNYRNYKLIITNYKFASLQVCKVKIYKIKKSRNYNLQLNKLQVCMFASVQVWKFTELKI
jgi:hypothetical protein